MVQSTFKINQSFYDKLTKSKRSVEDKVRGRLKDIAQALIEYSPNYSGAYVTSHSIKANNTRSRGRGKKSNPRPPVVGDPLNKLDGLSQLLSDIRTIDFESLDKVTFRNDSPHAREVEDNPGSVFPNMKGPEVNNSYGVYRKTKARFR